MPYKLTPGEIEQLWAAYCRACNSNMATINRNGTRVQAPRPVIYDMAGFCGFAGIDPRTVAGMVADPR